MLTTATDIARELNARLAPRTELSRALLHLPRSAELIDAIRLVSADADVSAAIVRAANLLAPSKRASVDNVQDAVRMIGLRNTQAVTLLRQLMPAGETAPSVRGPEWFLQRALRLRDVAAWVSDRLVPQVGEEIRILALLCDYGEFAIADSMPDLYAEVVEVADEQKRPVIAIEAELLGFTHAEVSMHLFREWALPDEYCDAIRAHHEPSLPRMASARVLARLLSVAVTLVESREVEFEELSNLIRDTADEDEGDVDPETVATITTQLQTATHTSVTFRNSSVGDLIEALRSR